MRNPGGYAVVISPDRSKVTLDRWRCEEVPAGTNEFDTFTCIHCNLVVHVKPRANVDEFGSMCRNCMKMVCPKCADGPCIPFQKRLDMMEASYHARRSYGI
jgi:hypothetical protein